MEELTVESLAGLVDDYHRAVGTKRSATVDPRDAEAVARLAVALVLGGSYCIYLGPDFLAPSVNAFCHRLGVQYVSKAQGCSADEMECAILTSMTAVPDLTISECDRRIRSTLPTVQNQLLNTNGMLTLDDEELRQQLDEVFRDPVLALLFAQTIGREHWRPDPSGGAALMAARIGLVEWTEGLFGMPHVRRECRRVLEPLPADTFLALERWSVFCGDACVRCPAQLSCAALCLGAV